MNIKLSSLPPGRKAIIIEFNSQDLLLKLMEMGCLPGEEISVEQIAPLGDPLAVSVAGYNLSLRRDEADQIMVEAIN